MFRTDVNQPRRQGDDSFRLAHAWSYYSQLLFRPSWDIGFRRFSDDACNNNYACYRHNLRHLRTHNFIAHADHDFNVIPNTSINPFPGFASSTSTPSWNVYSIQRDKSTFPTDLRIIIMPQDSPHYNSSG